MSQNDAELAVFVAREAGKKLLELREEFGPVDPDDKERLRLLRDLADQTSHVFIVGELAERRPDDAVLSEEGVDELARDSADRVWIVDPLDGTSEYGQGRHDFAVHIALWERDRPDGQALTVGVVDLPAQGITLSTLDDEPARQEIDPASPARIVVSRSRPPKLTTENVEALAASLAKDGITTGGIDVLNVGSVGAKVAEVLLGRADAYVHDSGFYEWDVAAPLAVAQHYGLVATHLSHDEVTFNHRPPWVSDLMVSVSNLAPYLGSDAVK